MDFIKIGKLVNTHGIKGEVKILSDFTKKDLVFIPGFKIYIGNKKTLMIINSYRHHKMFDMITLKGITNINDVLQYKGLDVFVNKEDLNLKGDYLLEDLIGMEVYEDRCLIGKINDLVYNNGNDLISVLGNKNFYIPIKGNFIKKVNTEKRIVEVENTKGLIIWK